MGEMVAFGLGVLTKFAGLGPTIGLSGRIGLTGTAAGLMEALVGDLIAGLGVGGRGTGMPLRWADEKPEGGGENVGPFGRGVAIAANE